MARRVVMFPLNHRYSILVSKVWVKYQIGSNSTPQFRPLMRAHFIRVDKSIPLIVALVNWFLFNSNISIEHSALRLSCPYYVRIRIQFNYSSTQFLKLRKNQSVILIAFLHDRYRSRIQIVCYIIRLNYRKPQRYVILNSSGHTFIAQFICL